MKKPTNKPNPKISEMFEGPNSSIKQARWVGNFTPLVSIPSRRAKTYYESLSEEAKRKYAAVYKFNKLVFGI